MIAGSPPAEVDVPDRGVVGERDRARQRRPRPGGNRQAVQREGRRPAPCSVWIGIHRQVARRGGAAGVHVDDVRRADGVAAAFKLLNGLCDRPSPLAAALFTYQTTFGRLIVTVAVLVTPLPSVSV